VKDTKVKKTLTWKINRHVYSNWQHFSKTKGYRPMFQGSIIFMPLTCISNLTTDNPSYVKRSERVARFSFCGKLAESLRQIQPSSISQKMGINIIHWASVHVKRWPGNLTNSNFKVLLVKLPGHRLTCTDTHCMMLFPIFWEISAL